MYKSPSFLRLALSEYGKAFGLSTTPVGYWPLVLIPRFISIYSIAFSVLKHYPLTDITF